MTSAQVTSVEVRHKHVDGWHIFQSDDLPGLYVASCDPEKAFNDIPNAIQALVEMDENLNCEVKMETSYQDFVQQIRTKQPEQRVTSTPGWMLASNRYHIYPLSYVE